MSPGGPSATIAISTKNRVDDLRRTLASIRGQTVPVEVIVMDDGSTDGTDNMVRCDFPEVRLHRFEASEGYIVQRNRAARIARAPIIVSLDDDAMLTSPDTIAHTLAEFSDPRIGAVAIPFINVREDDIVRQRAPDDQAIWVLEGFVGTAHALRRDLFLQLGGYRETLFHQGEEQDFAIRMLETGHVARAGSAKPIHHFQSPARSRRRMVVFAARNNVLYAWHNVPASRLIGHLAGTCARLLQFGARSGHPLWVLEGIIRGFGVSAREMRKRRPVSIGTYRLLRHLRKRGAIRLQEIAGQLEAVR